jgi:hypothetical protein
VLTAGGEFGPAALSRRSGRTCAGGAGQGGPDERQPFVGAVEQVFPVRQAGGHVFDPEDGPDDDACCSGDVDGFGDRALGLRVVQQNGDALEAVDERCAYVALDLFALVAQTDPGTRDRDCFGRSGASSTMNLSSTLSLSSTVSCTMTLTRGLISRTDSRADTTFERPMSLSPWMTCLCRFDSSTVSKSMMPSVPTPAAAR